VAEEDSAPEVDVDQVARIVSSYVQHHQIAPDQLITLIRQRASCPGRPWAFPAGARAAEAGGADPALGAAGLCYLSRVRISRAKPPPTSAYRSWARHRWLPHALEPAARSSIGRAELFGAALDGGQADGPRAQTWYRRGAPAG
jgi:hypothetical protein